MTDNYFANLCDRNVNHTDNMQFEAGTQIAVTGNYIYTPEPTDAGDQQLRRRDQRADHRGQRRRHPTTGESSSTPTRAHRRPQHRRLAPQELLRVPTPARSDRHRPQEPGPRRHPAPTSTTTSRPRRLHQRLHRHPAHHNVSGQTAVYVGPLNHLRRLQLGPSSPVGLKAAADELDDGARIAPVPALRRRRRRRRHPSRARPRRAPGRRRRHRCVVGRRRRRCWSPRSASMSCRARRSATIPASGTMGRFTARSGPGRASTAAASCSTVVTTTSACPIRARSTSARA